MSVSIYYSAKRAHPLEDAERVAVHALIHEYSVEALQEEHAQLRLNWESFCVYNPADPTEPGVVFEGATKLPDNSEDGLWLGVRHWAALLSRIRRLLHDADWNVHVDDHDLVWDDVSREYDPTQ